jgi:hypothetical protein
MRFNAATAVRIGSPRQEIFETVLDFAMHVILPLTTNLYNNLNNLPTVLKSDRFERQQLKTQNSIRSTS